jgi:hypothetical protein
VGTADSLAAVGAPAGTAAGTVASHPPTDALTCTVVGAATPWVTTAIAGVPIGTVTGAAGT